MPDVTTFLLVEDDHNSVFLTERVFKNDLSRLGFRSVGDGVQAVDYLTGRGDFADRAKHPRADVILLDLKMPRMDGFGFLEWLRSEQGRDHKLTPVVVLSSSSLPGDVNRAYSLGANAYMVKAARWNDYQQHIKMTAGYWADFVERPTSNPSSSADLLGRPLRSLNS